MLKFKKRIVFIKNSIIFVKEIITKTKKMTTQELKIATALLTTKEVLLKMLAEGFGETKDVFALSKMLFKEFGLNQEESAIVIENALKLC